MNRLRHSDNTCTVGWTSIHAQMTADDMRHLQSKHTEGYFTQTFFRSGKWLRTPEEFEECGYTYPMGFYFTFPRDEQGEALLDELFGDEKEANRWAT